MQGHFDILSLSGSFLLAEDGDTRSRTGGLSVALAGSDGRIVGGCVAGMLMAATPVQVLYSHIIVHPSFLENMCQIECQHAKVICYTSI